MNTQTDYIEGGKLIDAFKRQGRKFIPITEGLAENSYRDWNSLMPIVKKIEQLEGVYDVEEFLLIRDELCTARIETVYSAVVDFIKWYNEQ